jgi:pimeloyl-ACP methyl ester carboxylesterase
MRTQQKFWSRIGAATILWLALLSPVSAQVPADEAAGAIGIALEGIAYPYPVRFLPLTLEGRTVRVAYMDILSTGQANGRTVVLLHGKNFYGSYWAGTIRALSSAGYRVIVPDQVGFGKSGKPDDIAYSFDLLARNTAQLLDTLRIEKAAVVGHSMGGMLAVRFARNYPERVTHLVLENPIGLEDYRFYIPPATTEALTDAEVRQTDEGYRTFVRRYFVTWKPEYEEFVRIRAGLARSGEFPRWAKASALTYQMIYQQPVRHEFPLLRVPTLLVIGQSDRTVVGKDRAPKEIADKLGDYPALGKAAQKDIPNSRLLELPNVGHIPHLESPAPFEKALLDFLAAKTN